MPILAVDQFGRLYETSSDREDGRGFNEYPECVPQGDLTLGAAYLKSQAKQQHELLKLKRDQEVLDRQEAIIEKRRKEKARAEAYAEGKEARMLEHDGLRNAVMKKALLQKPSAEYNMPLSGNVLSANGQHGWAGMTRNEQTINSASMGRDHLAYRPDPTEVMQANERAEAMRILRLKARR